MTQASFITWKVTDQFYQRSHSPYKVTFFDTGTVKVEVYVKRAPTNSNGRTPTGYWRRVSKTTQRTAYHSALSHCRASLAQSALRDKHPDSMILHPLFDL